MQAVCEYGERCGVFILQEPEPYAWFLVDDLASAQQMQHDVARPNFGLLVDLGHMGLAHKSVLELEPAADTVLHAHFSDHQLNRHTDQVIGTGAMPLGELMVGLRRLKVDDRLRSRGYDELTIAFELGAPGISIADPYDWVQRSIAAVQALDPAVGMR